MKPTFHFLMRYILFLLLFIAPIHSESISDLFNAVREGGLEKVKNVAGRGADLNSVDSAGWTPVLYAASGNHRDILEFLIQNGADPEYQSEGKKITALMISSEKGYLDTAEVLVSVSSKYLTDSEGKNALHFAAAGGHTDILSLILQGPYSSYDRGRNQKTELAVSLLWLQAMKERDSAGAVPLIYAACAGHIDAVRILSSETDLNDFEDNAGKTPLICAAENGHMETVRILMENGADPRARNADGIDAFGAAFGKGRRDILHFMEKNEKIFSLKKMNSDLYSALDRSDWKEAEELIRLGADLNFPDASGRTLLMRFLSEQKADRADFLIRKGASCSYISDFSESPFSVALVSGEEELAEKCISGILLFSRTRYDSKIIFHFFKTLSIAYSLNSSARKNIYTKILNIWEKDRRFDFPENRELKWFIQKFIGSDRKPAFPVHGCCGIAETVFHKTGSFPLHRKVYLLLAEYSSLRKDFESTDRFLFLAMMQNEASLQNLEKNESFSWYIQKSHERKQSTWKLHAERKELLHVYEYEGRKSKDSFYMFRYFPDEKVSSSAYRDRILIRDARGRRICELFTESEEYVSDAVYHDSSDRFGAVLGRFALTADISGDVLQFFHHSENIMRMDFTGKGKYIGTVTEPDELQRNLIQVFNEDKSPVFRRYGFELRDIRFSPDGKSFAVSSDYGLRIWSLTGKLLHIPFRGHSADYLTFSNSGKLIAGLSGQEKRIAVWSSEGREICSLRGENVSSIAFSPEDRHILSGHSDGSFSVWDMESCRKNINYYPAKVWKLHEAGVSSFQFLSSGEVLLVSYLNPESPEKNILKYFKWSLIESFRKGDISNEKFLLAEQRFFSDGSILVTSPSGKFDRFPYSAEELYETAADPESGKKFNPDRITKNREENMLEKLLLQGFELEDFE
ncbi:MAG TPA: ankyrin repeat domain-containing protein [Leptospiraceae bacterium]|nr:ankyrin repeat domain-containing protein [Leptospiraceae bacterium]